MLLCLYTEIVNRYDKHFKRRKHKTAILGEYLNLNITLQIPCHSQLGKILSGYYTDMLLKLWN